MNNTHIKYTGKRQSDVLHTYILGNGYRSFNPIIKVFYSHDSMSPFNAGGQNGYSYCINNPVNHTDPTGHLLWEILASLFGKLFKTDISIIVDTATETAAEQTVELLTDTIAENIATDNISLLTANTAGNIFHNIVPYLSLDDALNFLNSFDSLTEELESELELLYDIKSFNHKNRNVRSEFFSRVFHNKHSPLSFEKGKKEISKLNEVEISKMISKHGGKNLRYAHYISDINARLMCIDKLDAERLFFEKV